VTRPGSSAARRPPRQAPLPRRFPPGLTHGDFGSPCPIPEAHAASQVSTLPLRTTHAGVDPRRPRPSRRRVRVVSRDAGEASRLRASMPPRQGCSRNPPFPLALAPFRSAVTRRLPKEVHLKVGRSGREGIGPAYCHDAAPYPDALPGQLPRHPRGPPYRPSPVVHPDWASNGRCVPLVVRDVSGFFGFHSSLPPIRRTT